MKAMGIDPGGARAGWAFFDDTGPTGADWKTGWFTPPSLSRSMQLRAIAQEMGDVAARFGPDIIGVETVYVSDTKSKQTALRISEVRGGILVAIAHAGAVILDVAASTAKKALTGSGRSDKEKVLTFARLMIGDDDLTQDEADAMAIALAAAYAGSKVPF